jgi:hypothetical protein
VFTSRIFSTDKSFVEVCFCLIQGWLLAMLRWSQTQVTSSYSTCTLSYIKVSCIIMSHLLHFLCIMNSRLYLLKILLMFSHEPIVQVHMSFFWPDFEQTHNCIMSELCIIWILHWIVWDYLWNILLLHKLYCLHDERYSLRWLFLNKLYMEL